MDKINGAKLNGAKLAAVISREITRLRDPDTARHVDNVSVLAFEIASRTATHFGLTEQQVLEIALFASFHDIGKLAISDEILLKPGPLTKEEHDTVKLHTVLGEEMISKVIDELPPELDARVMLDIILSHHEYLDGSGYPYGIAGKDISPAARIVTVADIFDAVTCFRGYKESWSSKKALEHLQVMADGGKIDPVCLQALRDYLNEKKLDTHTK